MRLSACIIVKNEADTLATTLESVRHQADEIIVVDGGSTDGSVEIARAAGAKIFVDLGNVSAARNRALAEAQGAYRLMIDGDEIARPASWPAFWEFVRQARHPLGRILQVSDTADGVASLWITRVCTSGPAYHYEGRIHEQLVGPGKVADTGLVVDHSGYSPATLARKQTVARNVRLLEAALEERPDDPYLVYQLGKTFFVARQHAAALPHLRRALALAPASASYLSALVCDLGYALEHSGKAGEALELVRAYQPRFAGYTDLWFLEGLCHMDLGAAPAMLAAFQRCLALGEAPAYATVQGVGSYRAHYNLGLFHELAGDGKEAEACYERALAASPGFAVAAARLRALRQGKRG